MACIFLTKKIVLPHFLAFAFFQGKLCPWTSCVFAPPPEAWRRWPIAACTSAASARGAAICHQAPRQHGSGVTAYMDHPPGMKWQHGNPFVSWKADWGELGLNQGSGRQSKMFFVGVFWKLILVLELTPKRKHQLHFWQKRRGKML